MGKAPATTADRPKLLVDANGLACRMWWANALDVPRRFGQSVMGLAVHLEVSAPAGIAVCWDSKGPTWRHEVLPSYKSNRAAKPDALVQALNDCKRIKGLHHYEAPGFEADDVIATFANRAKGTVYIMSEDKDMAQLVCSNGARNVWMVGVDGIPTKEGDVEQKHGVPPHLMRHLISWMGDSADCLPGVRGIGPKKGLPLAREGKIGDQLTYDLCGLATVPRDQIAHW